MVVLQHAWTGNRSGPSGREKGLCMLNTPEEDGPAPSLTVLYDGECPLCRREIGVYRGLQPSTPVCWADVSDPASDLPAGTSRTQLLARFHVRDSRGELLSGARAFLALWAALPGWRWLALVGRLPGAMWAMERLYRLFLRARPVLQRWAAYHDRPR
jgi:predicted DCC family thiol-disulfide oxidoreductase YuxK